ncbi:MAG TPA: hypothetical protein VHM67_01145 [Gemmatimonadaceae bacterium]|nr:hypothetical protein [Gemmatimonadaceae bacterium]
MSATRPAKMLGIGVLIGAVLAAVFLLPAAGGTGASKPSAAPPAPAQPEQAAAGSTLPTIQGSRFARQQLRHVRSPVSEGKTKEAEERCRGQVARTTAFMSKTSLPLPLTTEIFGVGDPKTGAGDSLIIEGFARDGDRTPYVWHCALSHFDFGRLGGPVVNILPTFDGTSATWSATNGVYEEARVRCLEAAAAAWPGIDPYPAPLINRAGDTLVVTGSFPAREAEGIPSRDYRCDATFVDGGIGVTVAEVSR